MPIRPTLLVLAVAAVPLFAGCASTDTRMLDGWHGYGDAHGVGSTTAVAALADDAGHEIALEGWVTEVCAVKGCWMRVRDDAGDVVLVRFRDYGFFVPRNARGRRTVLSGVPQVRTFSVEQRRHLLEDAGATAEEIAAVTESSTEVVVIADGVWIQGGGLDLPYAPPTAEDCVVDQPADETETGQ
jgi:hypothetical protein